jgi:hypothetical protein
VATEAAWLGGKSLRNEKNVEKSKKPLTGVGLLMEGVGSQKGFNRYSYDFAQVPRSPLHTERDGTLKRLKGYGRNGFWAG